EPTWFVCEIACSSVALGALFSVAAIATEAAAKTDARASRIDRCIACTTLQTAGRVRCTYSVRRPSAGAGAYSGTSQTAPRGGSVSDAEKGWSCQPTGSASTPPRFPTPDPP